MEVYVEISVGSADAVVLIATLVVPILLIRLQWLRTSVFNSWYQKNKAKVS